MESNMLVSGSIRVLMVLTAFALVSGAVVSTRSLRAVEKDDDEAQAAKDLAAREKKMAEDKARKAAEEEAKKAEAAKKEAEKAPKPAPAAKPVPVLPTRCVLCQDMKILPNLPFKKYIKFENEPPPNPDYPA